MLPAIEVSEKNISRDQAKAIAEVMVKGVTEGKSDPLIVWGELKMFEEAIKQAKDLIKDAAIDELAKHGQSTEVNGVKFTRYNGKRFYKYDHNPEWLDLKNKMIEIEKKMKMAQNANALLVDEDTGELIAHAKVTYSSETVSVELP